MKIRALAIVILIMASLFVANASACTVFFGNTPGYWKNHYNWPIDPNTKVRDVFTGCDYYGDCTLYQALSLPGGSGVKGAEGILLRAAVAGLLNEAAEDQGWLPAGWGYEGCCDVHMIQNVNSALLSNDRATMIGLACQMDTWNNAIHYNFG
jgi:hypothetical protein